MKGWIETNGVGIHWRVDGDPTGAPVLFLNSLGTDLRLWDDLVPMFNHRRIIRMDTRGNGLSDAPETDYSLDGLVEDTAAVVRHLGLTKLTVVGVSLGGMIAQALAAAFPDRVERLVLSNTAARMGHPTLWAERMDVVRAHGMDQIADDILDRWFGSSFRSQSSSQLWRNMLTRTPQTGYLGFALCWPRQILARLDRQFPVPRLSLGGQKMAQVRPKLCALWPTLFPMPNTKRSKLLVICPWLKRQSSSQRF